MYGFRWIDTSDPLRWKCEIPASYTVAEFAAEFDMATEVFARLPPGKRFVYLSDLSQVRSSDARNRERVARFLRECEPMVKRHMIAWAHVFGSPILFGAFTAVSWLRSFPVPTRAFHDRYEAEHWLDQQLALDQLNRERG